MSRGKSVGEILQPLRTHPLQSYLGRGLHTLGLLTWILEQTGPAKVFVSTFSTSDAFLRGFYNLKKKGHVLESSLVADLKASKKTFKLYKEMQQCFDNVYLAQNHSKVVLVENDKWLVTVISSQNQTYGDRAECTIVSCDATVFEQQCQGFVEIVRNSIHINGIYDGERGTGVPAGHNIDTSSGDVRPFGF